LPAAVLINVTYFEASGLKPEKLTAAIFRHAFSPKLRSNHSLKFLAILNMRAYKPDKLTVALNNILVRGGSLAKAQGMSE
jgi:hypothetical protein